MSSTGIFLSYRREDTAPYARLLHKEFSARFPKARVFIDLESIEAGLEFDPVIRGAIESCAVLIVLIGRQWMTLADEEGHRRLDNPHDYVRFEVQMGLERGIRVVPVLVDDAPPLREHQLPTELQRLARLQAIALSYGRYQYDEGKLLDLVQRELDSATNTSATEKRSPSSESAGVAISYTEYPNWPDGVPGLKAAKLPVLHTLKHEKPIRAVAFAPGGLCLATGGLDSKVIFWNPADGDPMMRMICGISKTLFQLIGRKKGAVLSLSWSPTDPNIVVGVNDGSTRVSSLEDFEEILSISGSGYNVDCVVYSPDGSRLATASGDKIVRTWDASTGKARLKMRHSKQATCVSYSPDGTLIASGGKDQAVRLWGAADGDAKGIIKARSAISCIAFDPTGRLLGVGTKGGTAFLWDLELQVRRFTVFHHGSVTCLDISADGRWLATGGLDSNVLLWDTETGGLHAWAKAAGGIRSVAFQRQGKWLAGGGDDTTAQIWDLAPLLSSAPEQR